MNIYELYIKDENGDIVLFQINAENLDGLSLKADDNAVVKLTTDQTINDTKTFNGYVVINGTAGDRHLITRGIGGSSGTGTTADNLYLNYGTTFGVMFGSAGQSYTDSAGHFYDNGKILAKNEDIPTEISELTNDSGYQTSAQVNTAIESKLPYYIKEE